MNLGLGELMVTALNVLLLVALPAAVILFAAWLLRRLRALEVRVAKLEAPAEADQKAGQGSPR